MGVVRLPKKSKMEVAEALGGGSTTTVWLAGGFGHPRSSGLGVAEPSPRTKF
jgi:hypothetical protein